MNCARFLTVFLAILGSAVSEFRLCDDAYHHFLKYSDIWKDIASSRTPSVTHNIDIGRDTTTRTPATERYTAKYLEDYAKHICSVVVPQALNSLRTEVAWCDNVNQTLAMLEEDGGFCRNRTLNNRIKVGIIDRLRPVNNPISCMKISDYSNCYSLAANTLKEKRLPVSSFRDEEDKFFSSIWECQVRLYKSHSDSCPNWQLPMLLSLDAMSVPALFRVKLTDQQIAMLELNTGVRKRKKKKGRKSKKVKLPKIKFGKKKKTKTSKSKKKKFG